MENNSEKKRFFSRFTFQKNPTHDNKIPQPAAEEKKSGFLTRLRSQLKKTHEILVTPVDELVLGKKKIDEETFENLEEILITSDVGPRAALDLIERVQKKVKYGEYDKADRIRNYLKDEILQILAARQQSLDTSKATPFVIITLGVNGSGKTTTIAKLANQFQSEGKKVLLAAADTFRAAAIEQLEVWGGRLGCDVIKQKKGSDPSAVAFDAVHAAKARKADVLIIDTAGRLHTKVNLIEELKKIKRIIEREHPGAPHESLLVLDATTGQNAISQAKTFRETLGYTGIILTKLDGSAKGGVIVGICDELEIPIRYIGIGEQMDDLREFNAREFVDALFD